MAVCTSVTGSREGFKEEDTEGGGKRAGVKGKGER
jgi:hypothetical protein